MGAGGARWGHGYHTAGGGTVWHETTLMSHQSGILHFMIFNFITFDYS